MCVFLPHDDGIGRWASKDADNVTRPDSILNQLGRMITRKVWTPEVKDWITELHEPILTQSLCSLILWAYLAGCRYAALLESDPLRPGCVPFPPAPEYQ